MTTQKKQLLQLQLGKKENPWQGPMEDGPARNSRKVLVFSPHRERLLAVLEPLSGHGHKCLFATTMKDALGAVRNESVGYVILDGDNVSPEDQEKIFVHIGLHRPDIIRKQKMHVFGARSASELRHRFEVSGNGIKPLEY